MDHPHFLQWLGCPPMPFQGSVKLIFSTRFWPAGPRWKGQAGSGFVSKPLWAGCCQHQVLSLKEVETQGKWKLPPAWRLEMEFFFFFSFPSNFEIAAGWRPRQSSSGLHDLFNRWLFAAEHALQEFVVVGSGDSRKPMGSYLPPPNFTQNRTMAISGGK